MNGGTTTIKRPLADGITEKEIAKLKAECAEENAVSCEVVTENNKRYLVCEWPKP